MSLTTVAGLTEEQFALQVDAWVLAALTADRVSFGSLLRALPGVYPTTALESVRRLAGAGHFEPQLVFDFEQEVAAAPTPTRVSGTTTVLPLPHPLDFEWRFAPDTCTLLLAEARRLSTPGEIVLLLGTPAVFAHGLLHGFERRVLFVGEANVVTERLTGLAVARGDVTVLTCKDMPQRPNAAVVLVDPPWYVDFLRPLLRLATQACRVGGHVLISLPPFGTRPSVRQDRDRTIAFARRLGLRVVGEEPAALTYDSPFFERNALAAVGFANVPRAWRRGDLFAFQRTSAVPSGVPPLSPDRPWREAVVEGVRIRTRVHASSGVSQARLAPIVEGDILPTVSRRDPRRPRVDVWTSGNRVFACSRPDLVHVACEALSRDESTPASADLAAHAREDLSVIEQLRGELARIVVRERAEAARFEQEDG